jgi:hypothetical protein
LVYALQRAGTDVVFDNKKVSDVSEVSEVSEAGVKAAGFNSLRSLWPSTTLPRLPKFWLIFW